MKNKFKKFVIFTYFIPALLILFSYLFIALTLFGISVNFPVVYSFLVLSLNQTLTVLLVFYSLLIVLGLGEWVFDKTKKTDKKILNIENKLLYGFIGLVVILITFLLIKIFTGYSYF